MLLHEGIVLGMTCLGDINLALPDLLRVLGNVNDQGSIVHLGCDLGHVSALW